MKNRLEEFITNNRSEMDVYQPREKLWDGIDKELHSRKRIRQRNYWVAAASVLLLLSIGIGLRWGHKDDMLPATQNFTLGSEIERTEVIYASMIEERRNEIGKYCNVQPQLCDEFDKALDTLNARYNVLKHEYQTTPDKKVVLQAMINNLQLQLQILSRQYSVIQDANQKQAQKII